MELYHVNNKNNFHKIWEKSVEYKLRNNILEFLLSRESEDDYYDLDKQILISQFEKVLKEMSIDCKLFYNRNVYKGDSPINCHT